ncbi:hypothetical protein HII31_02482 [Pseudocercospora fuligena]|uniref:Uncharacterized protein n=1 Tax=Pseudocercospora fuligena TaxID=685502 RepID=A0A8H6RPG6_9PEZI|nr:hypothetical protein HII31_02482 [Pseudocercospora fuligena]
MIHGAWAFNADSTIASSGEDKENHLSQLFIVRSSHTGAVKESVSCRIGSGSHSAMTTHVCRRGRRFLGAVRSWWNHVQAPIPTFSDCSPLATSSQASASVRSILPSRCTSPTEARIGRRARPINAQRGWSIADYVTKLHQLVYCMDEFHAEEETRAAIKFQLSKWIAPDGLKIDLDMISRRHRDAHETLEYHTDELTRRIERDRFVHLPEYLVDGLNHHRRARQHLQRLKEHGVRSRTSFDMPQPSHHGRDWGLKALMPSENRGTGDMRSQEPLGDMTQCICKELITRTLHDESVLQQERDCYNVDVVTSIDLIKDVEIAAPAVHTPPKRDIEDGNTADNAEIAENWAEIADLLKIFRNKRLKTLDGEAWMETIRKVENAGIAKKRALNELISEANQVYFTERLKTLKDVTEVEITFKEYQDEAMRAGLEPIAFLGNDGSRLVDEIDSQTFIFDHHAADHASNPALTHAGFKSANEVQVKNTLRDVAKWVDDVAALTLTPSLSVLEGQEKEVKEALLLSSVGLGDGRSFDEMRVGPTAARKSRLLWEVFVLMRGMPPFSWLMTFRFSEQIKLYQQKCESLRSEALRTRESLRLKAPPETASVT